MLVCPRCQRVNPGEAVFCHFDGAELRAANGIDAAARKTRLPHDFVFPSGRRCQTFDELVQGCQAEWSVARDLLRQDVFRQFLATAGRMDLAQAAQHAISQSDPDLALDSFLESLPATSTQGPRLDLHPRRLNLGTLHVGDTRQVRVTVTNQGKGLLQGTLAVAEGNGWLKVGETKTNGQCAIKTAREQQISLKIDTRGLSAPQKYSAKLTVITNGGIVELPVRLDLIVHPFPRPPFQGVGSPRDLAEKMRTQPKPAVPLLEGGDVARWFAVNGWTYPVLGPTAKGVAAVQQFFEGMGLSKAPVVQLREKIVSLSCTAQETIQGQVTLRTESRKWIYARAETDVPWLRVTSPQVSGPQQTSITFQADAAGLEPNRTHEGNVKIVANADQGLLAAVRLDVRAGNEPRQVVTSPSLAFPTSVVMGKVPVTLSNANPVMVAAAFALFGRLLLAVPAELYARIWASKVPAGAFSTWLSSPLTDEEFVKHFVLLTWWLGAVLCGIWLARRGDRVSDWLSGAIAGSVAGLALSATMACILPGLDVLPRWTWHRLAQTTNWNDASAPAWVWTVGWIGLAAASWTLMGGMLGVVLACAGQPGKRLLAGMGTAVSFTLRLFGLRRAATYMRIAP